MGSTRQSTESQSTQTTTPQPTAEERELNQLQLGREKFLDPQIRQVQSQGLDLINQLLQGRNDLPGFLGGLPGGISPDVTNQIVQDSLRDIQPQFQSMGLLNSGVNAAISARVAADVRRASEEFNIGNKLNLLNLGIGGQAQVQQPILGFSSMLSQRLQGLRPVTQTGQQSGSQTTRYSFFTSPFTQAIGQGLGQSAGTRLFGG